MQLDRKRAAMLRSSVTCLCCLVCERLCVSAGLPYADERESAHRAYGAGASPRRRSAANSARAHKLSLVPPLPGTLHIKRCWPFLASPAFALMVHRCWAGPEHRMQHQRYPAAAYKVMSLCTCWEVWQHARCQGALHAAGLLLLALT